LEEGRINDVGVNDEENTGKKSESEKENDFAHA
jgi:hypothetical protein